jgi:nitrite reductase/ring-hydroxylating ferredoxin subunit
MPATMEEKAVKDFMNTNKKFLFILILPLFMFISCGEENPEVFVDELPLPDPFQLSLNLDLVSYQSLQFEKNVILPDVGLNGVIVVKRAENDYAAFERTCPYEPEKECSIVSMNAGQQYLECECGNSFYNLSGYPTNSPSPRKLREYYTSLSGRNLYIDNTIVRSENR